MRLKKLIKRFEFQNKNRNLITLGTNSRLNPTNNRVELKPNENGKYSLDTNIYVKTWVSNPNNAKQWIGFECGSVHPRDDLGQPLTGVNFRLSNGADEYWWNGAAWEVNTANWNTENEISANISSFSTDDKKIQIIVNIYTTDETKTPLLYYIKVLYYSDISHQEDYIYRTMVRQLRENIRPITDYPIILQTNTNTIDLLSDDYKLDTPYNIDEIDAVFDHTNDPNHFVDLLQSYNSTTKTITLNSILNAGTSVWIRFTYEPEIAVTTGLDFYEIEKVPLIVISDIDFANKTEMTAYDSVANKATNEAVKIPGPRTADITMTIELITDSARDQARMADEMRRFFATNKIINSWGLDEKFKLLLIQDYKQENGINPNGIHSGKLRCQIVNALFFERNEEDVFIVARFIMAGDMNTEIT